MTSLIFKPVPFLEEKLNTPFSITKPLIIIVSKTLLQNLSLIYLMFYIIRFFSSEGNILLVFFIISFIMSLLLNMTVWFVFSGIVYILISKIKKEIKFNKIFELMGYGFMPLELPAIIISGAIGFKVPFNLFAYFCERRSSIISINEIKYTGYLIIILLAMLIIAAFIEAIFVIPYGQTLT
ncbi:MAG TPA: hypothetical protein DDW83_00230 [Peptococcaceae bacterium]|nr:hypothetical protein [Peptococcaceae bacterium]